jgi:ABC-2 type transport system permease protein
MTSRVVRLIGAREYRMRVRARAFVIATLVLMAGVVAMVVLTAALQDEDDRRHVDIGVVDASPALQQALVDVGDQLDTDVVVTDLTDADTAERAVSDGTVDLALVDGQLIWERETNDIDSAIVRSALQSAATIERASELGVDSEVLAELLQPVAVEERFLEEEDADRGVRVATASVGVILLFLAIQTYGNMVLMGVIEEKSSRVVEVLLNHVRPRELLAGKILGLGAVGLTQLVAVAASGLVALAAMRGVDVPNVPADAIVWFVVWFLLGFGLYATAFAMAGSLVSRQEDASSVVAPISIPFIASYLVSFTILGSPDSTYAIVLSLVPITAPMVMPVRIAAGDPSAFQIALSVGLTVVAIYALVLIAGRVYSRNVLRTGARVSWRSALSSARADSPATTA